MSHTCVLDKPSETGHYYKNGCPISKHPSENELKAHAQEWYEAASKDERETLDEIIEAKKITDFTKVAKGKTIDEIIDLAIEFWRRAWPYEVKPFLNRMLLIRQTLANDDGMSNDKHKLQLFKGSMPESIKVLLLSVRVDFFYTDKNGHCKNMDKFYSRFKIGKVHGFDQRVST